MLPAAPSSSDFTRRQALGVLGALALPWNHLLGQSVLAQTRVLHFPATRHGSAAAAHGELGPPT